MPVALFPMISIEGDLPIISHENSFRSTSTIVSIVDKYLIESKRDMLRKYMCCHCYRLSEHAGAEERFQI